MPQPDQRPGQPVLEGQLELDPVRRRHARPRPDRDLRDPGLCLRRATTISALGPGGLERHDPQRATSRNARADLQARFRRDFWIPERGCHALALDGDKRQVDSLTSNIGHLLWSGILDESEAAATAERLLDEQLYSGWGVRTLGTERGRLQPARLPHRDDLAARELADRCRPRPLRTPQGGPHDCLRDPRRGAGLRAPTARGLRRLPGFCHIRSRGVPDGVTSPGVGSGGPTAAAEHHPRPRTRGHRCRSRPTWLERPHLDPTPPDQRP